MNYLKSGLGTSRTVDLVEDRAKPMTPKSDRPRRSWGSIVSSLQTTPGLCSHGKCVRKNDHPGRHWPE